MPHKMKCKACGAEILFVKTLRGKSMPVDAERVQVLVESTLRPGCYVVERGYTPHWATCTDPDHFRRKG